MFYGGLDVVFYEVGVGCGYVCEVGGFGVFGGVVDYVEGGVVVD